MRRALAVLTAVLLPAACAVPVSATTIPASAIDATAGGPQTITFPAGLSLVYSPADLAIVPGTLTWSGALASHPLTFEDGTQGASTGASFARTVQPGVIRYLCAFHGAFGMKGVVYVAGPSARLTATPSSLAGAGTVTLDASATDFVGYTPNASATYAFDADGDGAFETSGGSPTTQASYALGTHTARVRVTGDGGRTGEATVTVTVGEKPPTGAPAAGAPGGGSGAPGSPAGGAGDTRAPALRPAALPTLRGTALSGGAIRLRPGTLSERATVRASLRLRGRTIGSAPARTAGAGPLTVSVRLTAAGRRTLRGLRSATLVLRLTLSDAAGNRRVVDRPVRLRR